MTPEFYEEANCKGMDPDIMHPLNKMSEQAAKLICGSCDVITECREWGIIHEATPQKIEINAVYGGLTGKERYNLRHKVTRERQKYLGRT